MFPSSVAIEDATANAWEPVRVLIAARNPEVYRILSGKGELEIVEALSADRAYEQLRQVDLAVVDAPDLVANGRVSLDLLQAAVRQQSHVVDSARFLQSPEQFLQEARRQSRGVASQAITPETVALVSYAGSGGGVGKTTLAVHLAQQFHEQAGLPVLIMESCYGYSGLASLLPGAENSSPVRTLHDLLSGTGVTEWEEKGVDLLGMNFELDRPHFDRENPGRLAETVGAIEKLLRRYALTILDTCWPHQVTYYLRDLIDRWIIVADAGRQDTLNSALQLRRFFQERELAARLIVNKRRRERLGDVSYDLALPYRGDDRFDDLGRRTLQWLYPQRASAPKGGFVKRLLGSI